MLYKFGCALKDLAVVYYLLCCIVAYYKCVPTTFLANYHACTLTQPPLILADEKATEIFPQLMVHNIICVPSIQFLAVES